MAGVKRIKTGKNGACHDKNVSDPGRAVSRILSALAGKPAAERAIYLLRPNPEPQWDGPPRAPYLVLLPMGFTVPPRLLLGRWALTPPFHPYPRNYLGGLFSVALSVGSPRPGVTRHRCFVESGLSSKLNNSATIQPPAYSRRVSCSD